jgi:hypothetical protein
MNLVPTLFAALLLASAASAQTPKESKHDSDHPPTATNSSSLAALEGLMGQPPERAMPILKKVLAGRRPRSSSGALCSC